MLTVEAEAKAWRWLWGGVTGGFLLGILVAIVTRG